MELSALLLGLILSLGLGLGGLVIFLRKLRDGAEAEVRHALQGQPILLLENAANSFGIESAGIAQIHGNGCLAWTGSELRFRLWMPRREFSIPQERLQEVTTVHSHLGKTKGIPLLKVSFVNDQGGEDSVALAVRDLDAWLSALGG